MRAVILTEAELEVGVHTIEMARLTGHAKPAPERDTDAAGLERKLRAGLEACTGEPTIAELGNALETLARAGLGHGAGVPYDAARDLLRLREALDFYADHGNYEPTIADTHRDTPGRRVALVEVDRGARARAALRNEARG